MSNKTIQEWCFVYLVVIALTATSAPAYSVVLASSFFGTNAEGWSLEGDATTAPNPLYFSGGGNPGGQIGGIDQATGGTWRFVAPSAFLGNRSSAYGGSLTYDLRFTFSGPPLDPFDASYVLISDGALTLGYVGAPYPAANVWNDFDVPLTETDWEVGGFGGPPATETQFRAVLLNLTSLRIRGEFNDGPDDGFLDNVVLNAPAPAAVPEPGSFALLALGLGGIGLIRRRRKS